MSIFSSIGHAISTGYHDVFGGGNNSGNAITTTTTTMAPLQKPQNSNSNTSSPFQGGQPSPMLNLQKPNASNNNPFGVPQVDASTLTKANSLNTQQTTQTTTQAPPQQPHASIWHNITHNPVTNVVGSVGKAVAQPFVQLGKGIGQLPEGIAGDIASMSSDPYLRQAGIDAVNHAQKAAFGTNDSGTIAKKIIGSTAGAMLTVAAPGIDNLAEAGASKLIPSIAETGLVKVGSRTLSNAGIGGTFNVINGVQNGQSPEQLAKSFGQGALVGGIGGAVFSGIPVLRKSLTGNAAADSLPARAAETTSETATDVAGPQTVDELATGITSANPEGPASTGVGAPTEPTPVETPTVPVEHPISTGPTLDPSAPKPLPQPDFKPIEPLKKVPTGGDISTGTNGGIDNTPAAGSVRTPWPAPVEGPVDNTPAYLRKAAAQEADAQARATAEADAQNLGAGTSPLDRPTYMHNQDIKAVISDGEDQLNEFIAQHPEATQADIEQAQATIREQVLGEIQKLQDARTGSSVETTPAPTAEPTVQPNALEAAAAVAEQKPVVEPLDANGNPMQVTSKTAANQAVDAGVSPNAGAPTNPAEIQATENAITPTPEVPGAPSTELKNARFQGAVVDNTKDPIFKHAFESDPITKDGQPLTELQSIATDKVSRMSLPELVQNYGQDFKDASPVTNPSQYYESLQAIRQLEQFPGDPTAAEAAANALVAVNDYAYRQGRGLAAIKVAYDNLPASMKVAYINKMVQKAGGELSETDMARLFNEADVQGKLAATAQAAEQKVSEIAATAAKDGGRKGVFNSAMKTALETEQKAQGALYDQNRRIVDIMTSNLPKSALGDRIAQSARTMMLSSVGGRAFAIMGTGFNTAQFLADNTLSAAFGKGINAFNRVVRPNAGAVQTSFARPGTLIKGAIKGIKGLGRDTFTGSSPVKSVDEYIKKPIDGEYSHDATRYGTIGTHITAPLRKVIRFGVGSHLALTKGIEDSSIEQAARASASELGVPKANMQGYVNYYKAHPPTNVADEAKQAWLGVNNLHQNGVSNALGKFASAMDNLGAKAGGKDAGVISGIAKQVRTVVIPFSHYMGGYVDKMLTDRNMVYNTYRIARARSPQELSDQLGHLTSNVGMAVGLGYGLSKAGIITNKDQDGKNYDGLYFHIGNRYIPVAFAGQAAMPIIMGATFYGAMNDGTKGQSWPVRMMDTTTKMATGTFDNALKASGVAGTFGSTSGPNELFGGNSGKGLPGVAGTMLRQHIPGFFGDINSGLDYTSLNPTHEKPLTKATSINPATGQEVTNNVKTEINKTQAAIPGLAQKLPRQAGEAAHDFVDRMLHSSQASGTQIQAAKDLKVQQDQSTADAAAGIPDPNGKYDTKKGESFDGAVKNAIANDQYDKAIPALQQKLATYGTDNKVDPGTTKSLKNQIKELGVTKDYGQAVRELYKNTSLTEWRDMGDPTSDTYDPATYQKLYEYDTKLARSGVAGASTDSEKNKFTAKTSKSGSGSGSKLVKDNTIGSTPGLASLSIGNLSPQKVGSTGQIPTIQQILPSQLIKPRAISVTRTR